MTKTRIILIVVVVVAIAGMYVLPKGVLENDTPMATNSNPVDSVAAKVDMHASAPAEVLDQIRLIRNLKSKNSEKEKNAIFADSLASLYQKAGKFDSAAWFSEEASTFFNTTNSWLTTANHYYEAFTFAVDQAKQTQLAGKAQEFYNKVLEKEPSNLDAKTNLAMTYVSSSSPMQGIMLLREVLQQNPKHEPALFNMGMLSVQSGQNEKAVERLEELVAINPNHTQGQLLLGIAWMNLGKKAKAKEQFEKVKQLDADPAVQAVIDSYLKDLK